MAAAQLRYTSLFSYTALLLIGYSLYDVETSSCERNIHKKVGDTVELSSCSPAEGVTSAYWKYGGSIIVKNGDVSGKHQFERRLNLNPSSLDLTVRGLTLQDSGVFSFLSEVNNKQRPTVTITLHVHEPITIAPAVTSNSTWYPLNQSCTVLLECSATTDSPGVTYTWAVGNETMNGSRLQHVITPQDGDTRFTCTISNFVNEKSTIKTVKCTPKKVSHFSPPAPLIIGTVIGILVFILLLLALLFYTKSNGPCCNRVTQDESQQPVYSSLLHGDGCVYETMRGLEDAGTGDDCVYE